jgi:hypothetical protein
MPNRFIDTGLVRHPDGFGVAWREWHRDADGELTPSLKVERFGPKDHNAFRETLKRVDKSACEYVAHFRMATHGPKAASHAHPYEYTDTDPLVGRVLVFHNGIVNITTGANESDTEVFVRDVLAHLPTRWWTQPALRYLVNEAIGWSRFVIMTAGETVNLHESVGEWIGGLWYSSTPKPIPAYSWSGAKVIEPHTLWESPAVKDARMAYKQLTAGSAYEHQFGRPSDEFWSGGHKLTAMQDIDRNVDGDYPQSVICTECYTIGDVFMIDGTPYIEMAHKTGADDADEESDVPILSQPLPVVRLA